MKRNIKSLIGYTIGALDGEIGTVMEFYFDDETWTIRYLIVETGNWLSGRKVLISPESFLAPDWNNEIFQVNLTKEEVKSSPDIDTEKPVSRQEEIKLYNHYPWKNYWDGDLWGGGMGTTGMVLPTPVSLEESLINGDDKKTKDEAEGDSHLRSTIKVKGYAIKAMDGTIGKVEDFIIEDNSWKLDFMVVDTGTWLPGKKILISPKWIKEINWSHSSVIVKIPVNNVKNSPEYNPGLPITEDYVAALFEYYGRLGL